MLEYIVPTLKIVLGSLVAFWFRDALMGGWWAGVALFLTQMSLSAGQYNIGNALGCGLPFAIIALVLSFIAIVIDTQVARYFFITIDDCKDSSGDRALSGGSKNCYCDSTESDFDRIFRNFDSADCRNPAARNPETLIANAVASALCVLSAAFITAYLLSAGVLALLQGGSSSPNSRRGWGGAGGDQYSRSTQYPQNDATGTRGRGGSSRAAYAPASAPAYI